MAVLKWIHQSINESFILLNIGLVIIMFIIEILIIELLLSLVFLVQNIH